MSDKTYPQIISDKSFNEWIKSCPLQVKQVIISKQNESAPRGLKIITCPCGNFAIKSFSALIEFLNDRREKVGVELYENIVSPESDEIILDNEKITYANIKIMSVVYTADKTEKNWANETEENGIKLPEQEIFWQTDPLYEQIRRECSGITNAKYKPDAVDGGWRCTCGQINLGESETCGACHVSRTWLREHLDSEYLEKRKTEDDAKNEKNIEKEIKRRKNKGITDKTKAVIILSSILLIAVLTVLTFTTIIPSVKYSNAVKALDNDEFDAAISAFSELGDFRDAKNQLYNANYKKAQFMTGIEDVYMTTSAAEPWYEITDEGVLSFKKDDYTGSWNNLIIPDVVDGVTVRGLDRNFCLNCKELTVITISDCVEVIGEQAFYNCEVLHTINFGKNVSEIGPRAFINCYALEEIEIPDTVTSLGLRAFNNCIKLKNVILGSGITKIGSYQFSMCVELERITLKSPITEIGEFAFSECSSFKTVFCRFSESQWTEPEIMEGNDIWESVELSFNN